LIGGKLDLDILSVFPQEDARIIGGIERYTIFRGQQWRRKNMVKTFPKDGEPLGKKGPLNRSPSPAPTKKT
jgi:hypothetical protein